MIPNMSNKYAPPLHDTISGWKYAKYIILVRQLYSQRRIRVNCAVNPISKHCMKGTKQACQVQKQTLEFFEAIIQSLVR